MLDTELPASNVGVDHTLLIDTTLLLMSQQSRLASSRERQARTARIMHAPCTDHPTGVCVCIVCYQARTSYHQRKDKTE